MDRKINLEAVTRRVAAGSILKWSNVKQGTRYDPLITQFHYKDDPLHDPMLDEDYVDYIIRAKSGTEYASMREINGVVFVVLEKAFAHFGIQLVDFKLEYGIVQGNVIVIDEITGGSFRLWPYAHKNPNLKQNNVLNELNPSGRLDKDTYRKGEDLDKVISKFAEIARITGEFKDLKLSMD